VASRTQLSSDLIDTFVPVATSYTAAGGHALAHP